MPTSVISPLVVEAEGSDLSYSNFQGSAEQLLQPHDGPEEAGPIPLDVAQSPDPLIRQVRVFPIEEYNLHREHHSVTMLRNKKYK